MHERASRTDTGMTASIDLSDLRRRAADIRWYHSIDLGRGVKAAGIFDPAPFVPHLRLPDLTGKTVLDVGAWDGFMSFEAERRGAARVLATDSFSWGGSGWGTKDGFELARCALASKVEDQEIDVMDLSPEALGGTFDVVLFLGVLYHMRDPVGALERVASVTGELLIVETEVGMLLHRAPAASFYPAAELHGDPTNWWAPNVAAVAGMLRAVGFDRVEVVWRPNLGRRVARWAKATVRGTVDRSLLDAAQRSRFVFHATR
jgi:tRNA (mo5U34)-methyltransferase